MSRAALEVWPRVQETLKDCVSRFQYDSWFRDLGLLELVGDVAALEAPDEATGNWVGSYYRDELIQAFASHEIFVRELSFRSRPNGRPSPARRNGTDRAPLVDAERAPLKRGGGGEREGARATNAHDERQHPDGGVPQNGLPRNGTNVFLEARDGGARNGARTGMEPNVLEERRTGQRIILNGCYTFDNFITGPCNRLPHAAARAVAEAPGERYNPLFIHGNVGLGKTHLLQAVCARAMLDNPNMSILYLSCEEFVNQFINAVEQGRLDVFRHRYRHLDMLIIDDIHFLANKERTQEEFFHTFNTLYNAQKQIILSSDAPPVEIPTIEDRLVSRFKWGLVTMIESPAFETRMAILKKKARIQGIELPDPCLQFLAENVDSSIREIEGAITKVAGYSRLVGQPITLPLIKEALRDILSVGTRKITIQNIIDVVCDHFDVKLADLQSKGRKQSITYPRQICMYLARKHTKLSLEEIGGYFGGRDHTTVLHADEKIRRLLSDDIELKNTIDRLEMKLRN